MSIKYNERGEVVSVNGLTTGQHIGKPMQDAMPDNPKDNEVYATQQNTVTNCENTPVEEQPKPVGGASSWNDLTDKPFGAEQAFEPIVFEGDMRESRRTWTQVIYSP